MEHTMERAPNFLPRVDEPGASNHVNGRLVTLTAPSSAAAEQYRTLYYRLDRLRETRPLEMVAFTSAVPGEGKTLTAVNLALTAARARPERRILLMDADLRRSQVAPYLGIRGSPGLFELLAGECEMKDVVRCFQATRLAVLPAGATPEEPTQVLASPQMKQMLKAVREGFDEVYLDLPPTLPFADATILGHQADGVVMVIRAHATPMRVVSQAVEQLGGAPLVGAVLNAAEQGVAPSLKASGRR